MTVHLWTQLERIIEAEGGEIVLPKVLWTFEGPTTFFEIGTRRADLLDSSRLVRGYELGLHDAADAIALVIVASDRDEPRPMLMLLADVWSHDLVSRWDCRERNRLLKLGTEYRPKQQEVSSLQRLGEVGWAYEFDEIESVTRRVVARLDEELGTVAFRYGLPLGNSRRNAMRMSPAEVRSFQELVRKRCAGR